MIQQSEIDQFLIDLDGTPNKSNFGSNAILAVSLAVAKAGAAKRGLPLYRHIADLAGNKNLILPVPVFNVVDGGLHAGNKLAIQVRSSYIRQGSRRKLTMSPNLTRQLVIYEEKL